MQRTVLNRLLYFCEKNKIIPVNQAGFHIGSSTIDHLVRITTQIKHQLVPSKCVLAIIFVYKKACDQVSLSQLLCKLSSVGLSGNLSSYVKMFLVDRVIREKLGNVYFNPSHYKWLSLKDHQLLLFFFNTLLYDLPEKLSNDTELVQYADDTCIYTWMKVTMKRKTPSRSVNYIVKLYQTNLIN